MGVVFRIERQRWKAAPVQQVLCSGTRHQHDNLNRLTSLEIRRSETTLIASYACTLGAAGNRLRVVEHVGRTVDYTYAALSRLAGSTITDPAMDNQVVLYAYDAAITMTDKLQEAFAFGEKLRICWKRSRR